MFGYVTVCREMMNEEDYELFQSYYCGICKATGNCASQLSRLGLSYDITFLALVIASVSNDRNYINQSRCIVHPVKKRKSLLQNRSIDYAAGMGVILSYLKFKDDLYDDKRIKALLLSLMFYGGVKKVRKLYKKQYNEITYYLKQLNTLEKENCSDIDRCADCFAKILEILFTPEFITESSTRRILAWLGYNTGRWIYIIDAYNDMERDLKKKNYNPFLAAGYNNFGDYRSKLREQLKITLTFTLENIASSFELLNIYKNKSVIEHIIYCGLIAKQTMILGEDDESL